MVRDVRQPNPPTPGRPRLSSSTNSNISYSAPSTAKQSRLPVPAKKRAPLGERNDNVDVAAIPISSSKKATPHSLSRFIQTTPKARRASNIPKPKRTPHPRVSMPLKVNEDDTMLLGMRAPESLFSDTDASGDEAVPIGMGRLMTPADSQESTSAAVKLPGKLSTNETRHSINNRLPTPPTSQVHDASSPPPTPRPPTQSRIRSRPSPTPPRRSSVALSSAKGALEWDTPLRGSSLPPHDDNSPNPRKKKSPRLGVSSSMPEPIRLKSPFQVRDRVEIVITPTANRNTPKPRSRPRSSLRTPSQLSSSSSKPRKAPATAPAASKRPRQSSAGTGRRHSTPRTVTSTRIRPRMSTGSLTPAARKALKGRQLGITPTMVEATDGDDPLLLRGPDDDLEGIVPASATSRRLEAALKRAGEVTSSSSSSGANVGPSPVTATGTVPPESPAQAVHEVPPLNESVGFEGQSFDQSFDMEADLYDPLPAWQSDDDTDVHSDDGLERRQEDTFFNLLTRRPAPSITELGTALESDAAPSEPVASVSGIDVIPTIEEETTTPQGSPSGKTSALSPTPRRPTASPARSVRGVSEVERLRIVFAPAEPIPLELPSPSPTATVLQDFQEVYRESTADAASPLPISQTLLVSPSAVLKTRSSNNLVSIHQEELEHGGVNEGMKAQLLETSPLEGQSEVRESKNVAELLEEAAVLETTEASVETATASDPVPETLALSQYDDSTPTKLAPASAAVSPNVESTTPKFSPSMFQRTSTPERSPLRPIDAYRTRPQTPFRLLAHSSSPELQTARSPTVTPRQHHLQPIEDDDSVSQVTQEEDDEEEQAQAQVADTTQEAEEGEWDISLDPPGFDVDTAVQEDDLSFEEADDQTPEDIPVLTTEELSRTLTDQDQVKDSDDPALAVPASQAYDATVEAVEVDEVVPDCSTNKANEASMPGANHESSNNESEAIDNMEPTDDQEDDTSLIDQSTVHAVEKANIPDPQADVAKHWPVEVLPSPNTEVDNALPEAHIARSFTDEIRLTDDVASEDLPQTHEVEQERISENALKISMPSSIDFAVLKKDIFPQDHADDDSEAGDAEEDDSAASGIQEEDVPDVPEKIVIKVIERGVVKVERDEAIAISPSGPERNLNVSPVAEQGIVLSEELRAEVAVDRLSHPSPRSPEAMLPSIFAEASGLQPSTSLAHTVEFSGTSLSGSPTLETVLLRRYSSSSTRQPSRLSQQILASSPGDGDMEGEHVPRNRMSLGREIEEAIADDDYDEMNESMRSVVEVSSLDPRAAARAAAILKMNHAYIEHGVLPTAPSSEAPTTPRRHQRHRSLKFESSHFATLDSARKLAKDELLHEAELEIVASRGRSMSVLSSRTKASGWESDESEVILPGGWRHTPGAKRKRSHHRQRSEVSDVPAAAGLDTSVGRHAEKPWSVADWKRLEKVFRAEREAWIRQREVKALPAPLGLFGWMRRVSGGVTQPEVKEWDNERVVKAFLAGEGISNTEALAGEWESSMILLRVKALEKRVAKPKTTRSTMSKSISNDQPETKKQRVERDVTPARGDSSIISIVPPSTIRRALKWAWGDVSRVDETDPTGTLDRVDERDLSGTLTRVDERDQSGTLEADEEKGNKEKEQQMLQVTNHSVSLPTTTTTGSPIPHPSSKNWHPADTSLRKSLLSTSRPLISTTATVEESTAPLYPPLLPPIAQRSTAIQALFDTPSHSSTTISKPIAIGRGDKGMGKGSPSVKDLVRSFEDSGVLKGGLKTSRSRASLKE